MRTKLALTNIVFVAASLAAIGSAAQEASRKPVLEEVIVTANKRTENLQDVPVAITGFTGDFLKEAGMNDLMSVEELTPGFNVSTFSLGQPQLYIRGIGSVEDGAGSDPSVATYVDGVYLGRPSASSFDFINVARIEVLRGPQGTLYGKNAVGGVVHVLTARPEDTLSGTVEASAGDYDLREVRSVVNVPFSDTIYSSFAVNYRKRDGYIDNKFLGIDQQDIDDLALNGQLLFNLSSDLDVLVGVDWEDVDRNGNGRHVSGDGTFGSVHVDDVYTTQTDKEGYQKRKGKGARVEANWDIESIRLTSLTAYREVDYSWTEDLFGVARELLFQQIINTTGEDADQFSQEFRLQSSEDTKWSWTTGIYYLWEDIKRFENYHVEIEGGAIVSDEQYNQANTTDSAAIFGEANRYITDKITLTAGLRYTYETKDFSNRAEGASGFFLAKDFDIETDDDWDDVTWNFVAQYQLNDDSMTYAKVSKGFKSGGFQSVPRFEETAKKSYDPENAINYELGLKSELFDSRVRLNIAAYYVDYSDLQVTQFQQVGSLPDGTPLASAVVRNAADAVTQGVEIEGHWAVTENLEVFGFYAFNDAEYKNFIYSDDGEVVEDYSGNSLKNAPRNSYAINARYRWDLNKVGSLAALVTFSYRDETTQSDANYDSNTFKEKELLNARITWLSPLEAFEVAVWGQNILDEEYQIHSIANSSGSEASNLYGIPHNYGVTVAYHFQ